MICQIHCSDNMGYCSIASWRIQSNSCTALNQLLDKRKGAKPTRTVSESLLYSRAIDGDRRTLTNEEWQELTYLSHPDFNEEQTLPILEIVAGHYIMQLIKIQRHISCLKRAQESQRRLQDYKEHFVVWSTAYQSNDAHDPISKTAQALLWVDIPRYGGFKWIISIDAGLHAVWPKRLTVESVHFGDRGEQLHQSRHRTRAWLQQVPAPWRASNPNTLDSAQWLLKEIDSRTKQWLASYNNAMVSPVNFQIPPKL
jgi:hypothetical protein